MRKDLEEKVAVTLARFDEAVKQSSTRRQSDPRDTINSAQDEREEPQQERDLDLAERITAEAEGTRPLSTGKIGRAHV